MADVCNVDDNLHHMDYIATSFFDRLFDVLHDLVGLLYGAVVFDVVRIIKVLLAIGRAARRSCLMLRLRRPD